MVAFAFKHDPVFARHFLKAICGAKPSSNPSGFSIEFQPEHHADLAICSTNRRELFVIEFKIGAELQPKQNPWDKSFFKQNGYGTMILNDAQWRRFKDRTYIVLQSSQISDRDVVKHGLRCLSRRWKDLVPTHRPKGLYEDLLGSLGGFGIPSLKIWKGNQMKLGECTKTAVQMSQLLSGIADNFNIPTRRLWNINQDQEDWWFTLDWSTRPPQFEQPDKVVKTKYGSHGGFGYQQHRKRKSERAVWFYCGNSKQQKITQMWLVKRLPQPLRKLICRYDEAQLYIADPSQTAEQDHAWFTEVFNYLKDRK